jgi:sugar lactone lactonase YvrE
VITATHKLISGLEFPEGLRWHNDRLWFSDMNACKVMSVDMKGNLETIQETPGPCSGLGWLPDERLLIVSMLDRRLLRMDADGLSLVADLMGLATYHCNDMVVDRQGRAYVGNFGFDLSRGDSPRPAEIIMVQPDGAARVVAEGLSFPNGIVITPDGKTLIVAETYGACLTAFDIEPDGSLSGKRNWATLDGAVPDGICLDHEGCIWVASPVSNEALRVQEGGEITDRVKVENNAYACMLGGPEMRTLFIATSGHHATSGRIEAIDVEIPGAGLP